MTRHLTEPTIVIPQLDDKHTRPLMAKMARLFREMGAMSEMRRFRSDLRLPVQAKRLSGQVFRLYDQYLSYTTGQLQKKGWLMYCSQGCSACCFAMPAGVSIWELLVIYDQLQQGGQLERYFRRNLESCEVLSRVRLELVGSGRVQEHTSTDETVLYSYGRAKQSCAFLNEQGECLIYPVRPAACRMHFAFTPPELCDPNHPSSHQAVRLNFSLHADVQEELKSLDDNLDLKLSDLLAPGLVTLVANVMRFSPIIWI